MVHSNSIFNCDGRAGLVTGIIFIFFLFLQKSKIDTRRLIAAESDNALFYGTMSVQSMLMWAMWKDQKPVLVLLIHLLGEK